MSPPLSAPSVLPYQVPSKTEKQSVRCVPLDRELHEEDLVSHTQAHTWIQSTLKSVFFVELLATFSHNGEEAEVG